MSIELNVIICTGAEFASELKFDNAGMILDQYYFNIIPPDFGEILTGGPYLTDEIASEKARDCITKLNAMNEEVKLRGKMH